MVDDQIAHDFKKLWDYIKENKLQTKSETGKPEGAGRFIVSDATLLPIFKNLGLKALRDFRKIPKESTIAVRGVRGNTSLIGPSDVPISRRISFLTWRGSNPARLSK